MNRMIRYIALIILLAFGLLTLFLSGSVIFDLFGIRAKEGDYVLFIVWSNFISSWLYLLSVYGFLKMKGWTTWTLASSLLILILAFIGLNFHINTGGIYELKTFNAMIFRIIVTAVVTTIAYFTITKNITK